MGRRDEVDECVATKVCVVAGDVAAAVTAAGDAVSGEAVSIAK